MPRQCPDTVPSEIPYKKYTRVKDLAAAVAEDQKILYFINLLFSGRTCARCYRELMRGTDSGHCSGTVRALSGHCQGTVKCVRKRLRVIVRICVSVCLFLYLCLCVIHAWSQYYGSSVVCRSIYASVSDLLLLLCVFLCFCLSVSVSISVSVCVCLSVSLSLSLSLCVCVCVCLHLSVSAQLSA